jgi:hypothetical protein
MLLSTLEKDVIDSLILLQKPIQKKEDVIDSLQNSIQKKEKSYRVQAFCNHRYINNNLEYYVKWANYSKKHNLWIRADELKKDMPVYYQQLVRKYKLKNSIQLRLSLFRKN